MNVLEKNEICRLQESVQDLALQVARLSQAIEPLLHLQQEQEVLRSQVAELQGFRAAILWLTGFAGTAALARYALLLWHPAAQ